MLATASMLLCAQCFAFDEDGYFSGMTVEQAKQRAKSVGLRMLGEPVDGTSVPIGTGRPPAPFNVNVAFCKNVLFFYSRHVDVDADYAPTLRVLLKRYGQPNRVESNEKMMEVGGRFYQEVTMTWLHGADRIALSLTPQVLDTD